MVDESITQLLLDASAGKPGAVDALFPIVYSEMRRLSGSYLRRERPRHTLQGTALVHEAYLRLIANLKTTPGERFLPATFEPWPRSSTVYSSDAYKSIQHDTYQQLHFVLRLDRRRAN